MHIDSPITNVPAKSAKSSVSYTPAKSKSSITDAARSAKSAKSTVTDAPAKSVDAHN